MQLTGHEIKELLDLVNPDAEAAPEQLDESVTLVEREAFVSTDGEQMPAGIYAILTDHSEEGLYGPLSGNDKRTQRINREIKEVAAYLVDEMKAQLSHFSGIQWQSPDTVPDVELGGEKGYWIAVKSIRNGIASEHTFLANYLNKPKLFNGDGEITDESADWLLSNDDSNEVEAIGWHDAKEHAEYSNWYEPITFNENYVLLGWAEYNAPPFFVSEPVKPATHSLLLPSGMTMEFTGADLYCGVDVGRQSDVSVSFPSLDELFATSDFLNNKPKTITEDPDYKSLVERYSSNWTLAVTELFGMNVTPHHEQIIKAVQQTGSKTSVVCGDDETTTADMAALSGAIGLLFMLFHPKSHVIVVFDEIRNSRPVTWEHLKNNFNELCDRQPWIRQYFTMTESSLVESTDQLRVRFCCKSGVRIGNEEALAGEHSEHLFYIVDRADQLSDMAFRVIGGAMTREDNRILLTGNPTRNSGYFYDSWHQLAKRDPDDKIGYTVINMTDGDRHE